MNTTEIIKYGASRLATVGAGLLSGWGFASDHTEPFVYAAILFVVDAGYSLYRWLNKPKG